MKIEFLKEIGLNEEQIKAVTVRNAVETLLKKERFSSEFARKGIMAELWAKGLDLGEDGEITGLEEAFGAVKEANPDAFATVRAENPNKLTLPPVGGTGSGKGNNPFRRETWNMAEQARLLREDRDMAVFFQRNAGK